LELERDLAGVGHGDRRGGELVGERGLSGAGREVAERRRQERGAALRRDERREPAEPVAGGLVGGGVERVRERRAQLLADADLGLAAGVLGVGVLGVGILAGVLGVGGSGLGVGSVPRLRAVGARRCSAARRCAARRRWLRAAEWNRNRRRRAAVEVHDRRGLGRERPRDGDVARGLFLVAGLLHPDGRRSVAGDGRGIRLRRARDLDARARRDGDRHAVDRHRQVALEREGGESGCAVSAGRIGDELLDARADRLARDRARLALELGDLRRRRRAPLAEAPAGELVDRVVGLLPLLLCGLLELVPRLRRRVGDLGDRVLDRLVLFGDPLDRVVGRFLQFGFVLGGFFLRVLDGSLAGFVRQRDRRDDRFARGLERTGDPVGQLA